MCIRDRVALGFLLNYLLGKKKMFSELQKIMPGVAVLGLACVVGGEMCIRDR